MTKRSALVACGAAVLAVAGYFTSRASKYTAATSAYYQNGASFVTIFKGASALNVPHLTTQSSNGTRLTAFFATRPSGTQLTMFATKSTAHRIYYKP